MNMKWILSAIFAAQTMLVAQGAFAQMERFDRNDRGSFDSRDRGGYNDHGDDGRGGYNDDDYRGGRGGRPGPGGHGGGYGGGPGGGHGYPPPPPPPRETTLQVECQSWNNQTAVCQTALRYIYNVTLIQQYSSSSCAGKYGHGQNGEIWAVAGCRGLFLVQGSY